MIGLGTRTFLTSIEFERAPMGTMTTFDGGRLALRPFRRRTDTTTHLPSLRSAVVEHAHLEKHGRHFIIDDTPRHELTGSTEVVLAGPHEVASTTWRPSPMEIISDVVVEYFVRRCERELGEPLCLETSDGRLWRWSGGGYVREVLAARVPGSPDFALSYIERPMPTSVRYGVEID